MKINGRLVFDASGLSQIENLRVEKVSALPVWGSADVGRLVYVTSAQVIYLGGATDWIALATGGNAAALQSEVDAIEASLGVAVNGDGTFNAAGFVGVPGGEPTSFTDAINKLAAYATGKDTLAELDDVTITAATQGDVLVVGGAGRWVNRQPGAASGVQPNSDILHGVVELAAGTGVVVKTGADDFAVREIVGPAAGITVTNGNGVAGNPTLALANDLAALEGLTTNGYIVRTGDGTATTRSLTGTENNIVVTNGDGVASDTSIDLAPVTAAAGGTFQKFTSDGFGRVTAVNAVVTADITALVDNVYVNADGDTMTGNLTFSGGAKVTGLPLPTADSDAANKGYVDAAVAGLSWKDSVRVATLGNIDIAAAAAGYDGVTLANGDRVLVRAQTDAAENGIYVFNGAGAALTLATDFDDVAELAGATVFVTEGTTYHDTGWTQTAEVAAPTDAKSFSQFSGASVYTFGTGLEVNGNTVSVLLGAGIGQNPANNVGVDLYAPTTGAIVLTTDGTARSTDATAKLHLLLKAAGGLTQDVDGLYIGAGAITNTMLVNDGVGLNADTGSSNLDLGQTLEIRGDSVKGIKTSVAGQVVTITADDATSTQKGVASFSDTNFAVTAGVVTLDSSLGDLNNVAGGADGAAEGSLLVKGATEWESVSRADFFNGVSIDELGDVEVEAPVAGQTLVYDGVAEAFVNKKIYFEYHGQPAAAVHTVTHDIGQKYCNVTVVDASDNVVIPESVVFNSANELTVTFNTAIECRVIVMGVAINLPV